MWSEPSLRDNAPLCETMCNVECAMGNVFFHGPTITRTWLWRRSRLRRTELTRDAASAENDGAAQNDILAFGTRVGVIARHDAQRVFTWLQVIRAPEVVIKSAFGDIGVNMV